MTARTYPEKRFNRSAWLVMIISLAMILYAILAMAYYLALPTDGWLVNEASDLPGKNYIENVMGGVSALQPGDRVVALDGIPVEMMDQLPALAGGWRVGAVIDYLVIRNEQQLNIPVTLMKWQAGKWFLNILLNPAQLAELFSHFLLLGLAVFIVFRQPGNPSAKAFLLMMTLFTATWLGDRSPQGTGTWVVPLARFLSFEIDLAILITVFPFALIQFALVFPHPKPIYERHPWLPYAAGAVGPILLVASSDESPLAWFWLVFSFFLVVGILIHNAFTMRDAVSRAQLRWGLGGLIFNFGLMGLALLGNTIGLFRLSPQVFNDFFSLISVVGQSVMGVSLAVAILRYRLWDIDILIRRTLVYTVLTAMLGLVYFGLVILLDGFLRALVGGSGQVATVISTLAIAALFTPLRRRVQEIIDRRFYRQKYNAEQALAEFAAAARDETDLEALT
ncbi:MAG: hypothetical protein JSV61_04780, partial [Anaerolineales bacterium]